MSSFEYQDKTYELKLTRAGIRQAEAHGLSISDMQEKPFSSMYALFFASMYATYKMPPKKTDEILDEMLDDGTLVFDELYMELIESYNKLFGLGESEK